MNRIDHKFKELKRKRKKAFIAFITAGDPSLKVTEELVLAFEKNGVDIIELGVPFSDPLADGPTIQAASQRALKNHVTLNKILNLVKKIRLKSQIPIALMTYYNPVFRYGDDKFVQRAVKMGVDGVIVPDLPPEEAGNLIGSARKNNLSAIFFLSPTTTPKRMRGIIKVSSGFIYYVSLTGVTGARRKLDHNVTKNVRLAKRLTGKPICVGFGVSTSQQVKAISKIADGVIIGSVIIKNIEKNKGKKNLVRNVSKFVHQLTKGLN